MNQGMEIWSISATCHALPMCEFDLMSMPQTGRPGQRPIKSNHSLPRFAAEEYGDLTGSGSPLRTHVKNTQMQ